MELNFKQMLDILVLAQKAGPAALQNLDDQQKIALDQIAQAILNKNDKVTVNVNLTDMKYLFSKQIKADNYIKQLDHPSIEYDDQIRKIENILHLAIPTTYLEQSIDKAVEKFDPQATKEKIKKLEENFYKSVDLRQFINKTNYTVRRWKQLEKKLNIFKKQINTERLELDKALHELHIKNLLNSNYTSINDKDKKFLSNILNRFEKGEPWSFPGEEITVAEVIAKYDERKALELLSEFEEFERLKSIESSPKKHKEIIGDIIQIEQEKFEQLKDFKKSLAVAREIFRKKAEMLGSNI